MTQKLKLYTQGRTMRSLLIFISVLVLGQLLCGAEAQQCPAFGSEQSIYGWMLQRHIYKTTMADLGLDCLLVCRKDNRCQSFNFVMSLHMCEFSDRTKEARPEDFIPDPDRYYFRRDIKRVPLGSIPDLAAESCKEIKRSEGQATSRKYWMSSIKLKMAVLAHCDMKTGDVDECTASSPVCDVNATCDNTLGSYRCTCKVGFSGDGKTCSDVDECTASSPVCDVNATCDNTLGSYRCTCKVGFSGDGKTCSDVDECTASSPVCDVNATCDNTLGSYRCTCKVGFSGDGRTCSDVDECTASPSVCDVNAICNNAIGSYHCTCKAGFFGDGKTCTGLASECKSYTALSQADRAVANAARNNVKCDGRAPDNIVLPTWYRMTGASGDKIPEKCVPKNRCGTHASGWLNGSHPTFLEGVVTRQVCYHWSSSCCLWKNNIKIRNCGSYFVYQLIKPPACYLRYCGDKGTAIAFETNGRTGRFGVIQTYTIPKNARYRIRAWGARGGTHSCNYGSYPGTYYGGRGALKEGTFTLIKGTVLNIVVGHRGGDSVEVKGGQNTTRTAAELGLSVEDNAGTGGGGGSFVYTTSNTLLLAAGGGGGASAGFNGMNGQANTSGSRSVGKLSSQVRNGGIGGQPGECNSQGASWHGGVGAGWLAQGCVRARSENGEGGGSRAQGWFGGRAGKMNSGNNGGPSPGAVGGFGGGGGGSEDNGASGGGGGFSGGGSGTHPNQAGGGGGSFCSGANCSGESGANSNDYGRIEIVELV